MNEDKTLLELAAKSAGIEITWENSHQFPERLEYFRGLPNYFSWNPLKDDGDALRLAVKLGIDIQHHFKHVEAWRVGLDEIMEYHDDDPYEATRRAIVRAAAMIGELM